MIPKALNDGPADGRSSKLLFNTILELIALAVIVPEVTMLTWPRFATVVVPLLALVPMLFAVRYGFHAGVSAALLAASVLFQLFYFPPHVLPHFPKIEAAHYLLAAAIAGHFHDHWSGMLRDARKTAEMDRLRLAQFTARFHLLQASHNDLERHLGASRTSLRASVQQLRDRLAGAPENAGQPLGGIGKAILEVLAEPCHVFACAAYEVKENTAVASTPVASIGAVIPLSPTNPLLREALDSASVISVRAKDIGVGQIIAVVPLVDVLGRIHGVVTINQMSFTAIHQNTFDLMAVMARQAANILSGHSGLMASLGDTTVLRASLRHNLHLAQYQGLQLAVVILRIMVPTRPEQLVAQCLEVYRSIDQPWQCRDCAGHPVLVMLMPVPDDDVARSQVQRLRKHLAEHASRPATPEGVETSITVLPNDHDLRDALGMTLTGCHMLAPPSQAQANVRLEESLS